MSSKLSNSIFRERAKVIHDDKYDYSLVDIDYLKQKNIAKIDIICPIHGIFNQIVGNHLQGHGCPDCRSDAMSAMFASNAEEFECKAKKIFGSKYLYHKVIYKNSKVKVEIICREHGSFWQTPNDHINGHGCPKCKPISIRKKRATGLNKFIQRAQLLFGDKYDYTKFDYVNSKTKGIIICPSHGSFWQTPNCHLRGHGCPTCGRIISRLQVEWLDYLDIPNDTEHREVYLIVDGIGFCADGYAPVENIIYEFYGNFWHGNPNTHNPQDINPISKKSFGSLYKDTMKREKQLKKAGYKIVSIWESDWLELKKKIQK